MRRIVPSLTLLLLSVSVVLADATSVFGPERFHCRLLFPNVQTRTFHATPGTGTLHIRNGGLLGLFRVSNGEIIMNVARTTPPPGTTTAPGEN